MRYLWGGLSLIAFAVAGGGLLIALGGGDDYNRQALGGVIAFVGLLTAYFAYRIGRHYRRKRYEY